MNIDYENFTQTSFESDSVQNQVECSLNLSSENYDKVLSLSGYVSGDTPKIDGNGSASLTGKVYFNAIFQGEEIERVEAGAKFEFRRTLEEGLAIHCVDYSLDDVILKKDGGMLYASAFITAKITFRRETQIEYCASTDLLCRSEKFTVDKIFPCKKTYDVEDEFETAKIKKALYSQAQATVLSVKASENAILVDGDVLLSLVLLPFSENSDIVKERRSIPFRFEIDCDNSSVDALAFCRANVSGVTLKVYTDEETGRCQVAANVSVNFSGGAVKRLEREAVVDAFSESCELNLTPSNESVLQFCGQKSFSERIFGKMDCDVPEYSRFVKFIAEGVEAVDFCYVGGETVVSGVVFGEGIFSGENGIVSKRASLPFEIKRSTDAHLINGVSVALDGAQVKQRSGALEGDFTLRVGYMEYLLSTVTMISKIEEGEEKSVNKSVITVYLGKKGDTEWDVVKALGEPIEDVQAFNPQLEFPLIGGEKVMIFRRR